MSDTNVARLAEAMEKLKKQSIRLGDLDNRKYDLTMLEAKAIQSLYEMDNVKGEERKPITPSRLSRHMGMQAPIISPILTTLEQKGKIIRRPDPDDRRSVRIQLTDSGRDTACKSIHHRQVLLHNFADFLGDEDMGELIRIISKIEQFLAEKNSSDTGEDLRL